MKRGEIIVLSAHDTYFYRCEKCHGLVTLLDERAANTTGRPCPCGYRTYRPTNLTWRDCLQPKVWIMALLKVAGAFDDSRSTLIHDELEG